MWGEDAIAIERGGRGEDGGRTPARHRGVEKRLDLD